MDEDGSVNLTAEPDRLDRALGLSQVTASGVGIIIGAGVYVLIGSATELAGPRVWMAFLLAAVLSALTGLSYAELASMFPKAGAEFEYARHVYPPWVAFLVGWVMIAGLVVAAAAVALGFGRYARWFVDIPEWVGALTLLGFVATLALSGIRRTARVTLLLSLIQVGGLVYVITIGVPHIGDVDLLDGGGTGAGGVLAAGALVFFAFIGFDEVITLSEETRDPTRTVPRALLLSLAISTVLYLGVAVAAVSVIGAPALGASERPLADVLAHALGDRGASVVAVIALIATTNTTLLCVTAASRLQYGMATAGVLPSSLGRLGRRSRAPSSAIVLGVVVAAAFVLIRDLTLVASVTDFAVYVVFVAVNVAVILLRYRSPEQPRPFRTPGSLGRTPVLPVLALLAVLMVMPTLSPSALALGVGLCILGVLAYTVLAAGRRRAGP